MTNKMNDLTAALTAQGFSVRSIGDTLFVNEWGIHCSLTGNVQARSMWDSADRFGLGTMNDSAESLAASFAVVAGK